MTLAESKTLIPQQTVLHWIANSKVRSGVFTNTMIDTDKIRVLCSDGKPFVKHRTRLYLDPVVAIKTLRGQLVRSMEKARKYASAWLGDADKQRQLIAELDLQLGETKVSSRHTVIVRDQE